MQDQQVELTGGEEVEVWILCRDESAFTVILVQTWQERKFRLIQFPMYLLAMLRLIT